jgi:hypothetical protein
MRRFVEGTDRGQSTLFPEYLEDWIGEDPKRTWKVVTARSSKTRIEKRDTSRSCQAADRGRASILCPKCYLASAISTSGAHRV